MADDLGRYRDWATAWCAEIGVDPMMLAHRIKNVPLEVVTPGGTVWVNPYGTELPRPVWMYYAESLRVLDELGFLNNG